ncbi:MAG: Mur ligase family protein [Saprospiraceae bacterium]
MSKKVHFIAIGGSVMHNLALDMYSLGYIITGSDDEIYEPSSSRLKEKGLFPPTTGWDESRIHEGLDFIVLGMHAKIDNIELVKAQKLGLEIYSYPELIYNLSKDKKRVVVAGSHGKTTITSMILHVLAKNKINFDYVVGAHIEGFTNMVKISDAPLIVVEGDEYLSSPVDPRPKMFHYRPHISVLTGIAWDHINVFPTFESYVDVFKKYLTLISENGNVVYNQNDTLLQNLINDNNSSLQYTSYDSLSRNGQKDEVASENKCYPISIIGQHNLSNMAAALEVCRLLGISEEIFLESMYDFKGAAKRLQKIAETKDRVVYLDFAHAPSKVKATTHAFKMWYPNKKVLGVFELHTFSSLDARFLPQYKDALENMDEAVIYYSEHASKMKNKPIIPENVVLDSFHHNQIQVIKHKDQLTKLLLSETYANYNILLMTSGNFDQLDLKIFKR